MTCIHLRKDYHAHLLASRNGFAFMKEYYTLSLEKSKSNICDEKEWERDMREKERENTWAAKGLGSGPSVASAKMFLAPTDSSSSMAATLVRRGTHFLCLDNSARPLANVCLVCARKGHKISDCTYQNLKSGEPTKCKPCDDKADLIVMVKAMSKRICILFNINTDRHNRCKHS